MRKPYICFVIFNALIVSGCSTLAPSGCFTSPQEAEIQACGNPMSRYNITSSDGFDPQKPFTMLQTPDPEQPPKSQYATLAAYLNKNLACKGVVENNSILGTFYCPTNVLTFGTDDIQNGYNVTQTLIQDNTEYEISGLRYGATYPYNLPIHLTIQESAEQKIKDNDNAIAQQKAQKNTQNAINNCLKKFTNLSEAQQKQVTYTKAYNTIRESSLAVASTEGNYESLNYIYVTGIKDALNKKQENSSKAIKEYFNFLQKNGQEIPALLSLQLAAIGGMLYNMGYSDGKSLNSLDYQNIVLIAIQDAIKSGPANPFDNDVGLHVNKIYYNKALLNNLNNCSWLKMVYNF